MPAYFRIWDVEHGACAMLWHKDSRNLAMVDSGDNATEGWNPSSYLKDTLKRDRLDYLFITNADQDHISDLAGLAKKGVKVSNLFRNKSLSSADLRQLKAAGGRPLTVDMEQYLEMSNTYTSASTTPFNEHMGGITQRCFYNKWPEFKETNDLSLVAFFSYGDFTICFPGDMEKAGWQALLRDSTFREYLTKTDILVASHHGRENGYCEDVFDYCTPNAVVISDKAKVHDSQEMVPDYARVVSGIHVATTGKTRHVLTTRRDGWIQFEVEDDGSFRVLTECKG